MANIKSFKSRQCQQHLIALRLMGIWNGKYFGIYNKVISKDKEKCGAEKKILSLMKLLFVGTTGRKQEILPNYYAASRSFAEPQEEDKIYSVLLL